MYFLLKMGDFPASGLLVETRGYNFATSCYQHHNDSKDAVLQGTEIFGRVGTVGKKNIKKYLHRFCGRFRGTGSTKINPCCWRYSLGLFFQFKKWPVAFFFQETGHTNNNGKQSPKLGTCQNCRLANSRK